MGSTNSRLLVKPDLTQAEFLHLTPQRAGWDLLHFGVRRIAAGETWSSDTKETEIALVLLSGTCTVRSNRGNWEKVGRRPDVFHGMPYTLYLPRHTQFEVQPVGDSVELAYGWVATDQDHPACLVTPQQVRVEIRGGANATRQINHMIPPGSDVHRLVVCEVYTPPGNWSSYPPHKHDVHTVDEQGRLIEADLEEVYFYKIDRPEGYAYQRVYTGDGRLDELVLAHNNEIVLVPEGYHPVVSAHGYTTYYLNFLAGSAQSLAASDDPELTWIKSTWKDKDPRVPVVTMDMEK